MLLVISKATRITINILKLKIDPNFMVFVCESTIMLREISQGESSVMRLRLEGCKNPLGVIKKPL